jgi:phosphodiesterase/alkaline phosphatase D-like protein
VRGAKAPSAAAVALAVIAVFVVLPSTALAASGGWISTGSFGSAGTGSGQLQADYFGTGGGAAVDESTGDLYVADTGNARIEKFDASGNFIAAWGFGVTDGSNTYQVCTAPSGCHAGLPGTAPGQFSGPSGVAVDNSNGPNAGDVYVVDGNNPNGAGENDRITKFSPSGTYLSQLDASTSPGGAFQGLAFNGAVAVDRSGFVWVADANQRVLKFSNQASNAYVVGSQWSSGQAGAIGINGAGTKAYLFPSCCYSPAQVFDAVDGSNPGNSFAGGGYTDQLAVNQATGRVFASSGGSQVDEYQADGTPIPGTTFGAGMFSFSDGIAVNSVTETIYVVDLYGSKVVKFVPRIVPDVTTGDPTGVGHDNATLTGQVAPDPTGGGDVSDCHFEYGETTSYGSTAPCVPATPYSGNTAVTANLSGLTPDVTYHYRLVASNSIGPNQGADKTFTPNAVLDTTTGTPSSVTQISATLNGSFTGDNHDTHFYFEWGTDTSYGNTTPALPGGDAGATTGNTPVSADISGLSEYTFYHYRLVTTNSIGTTHGVDRTFYSAPPIVPDIQGTAASGITPTSATISAQINPGYGMTIYLVEYGTSATYDQHTAPGPALDPDNVLHSVSQGLTGLSPATTYHFRIVAVNFGGVTNTQDQTFTTPAVPRVVSTSSSGVDSRNARVTARINPNLSPTTYHFEFGTDGSYGSRTSESAPIGSGTSDEFAGAQLSGLAPSTTYHFRVIATNGIGTTTGSDQTFTTSAAPAGSPPPPAVQKCKTGFVRRHGKCVRKKRHQKRHQKRHHRHLRGHGNG